jgi:hypothetical protein
MATSTKLELLARALGMTLADFKKKFATQIEDPEGLATLENLLNDQTALVDNQNLNLKGIEQEIANLSKKEVDALGNTGTARAEAKSKADYATKIDSITNKLETALNNLKNTRGDAFENTFGRQLLDTSSEKTGERAIRSLDTQSDILDSIVNGTKAAQWVATQPSLSWAGFARHVIGNPFDRGVVDARQRLDVVKGAFDQVQSANKTAFQNTLLKDTPLSEIQTAYNARKAQALASTEAQLAKDVIPANDALIQASQLQAQIEATKNRLTTSTARFDNSTKLNSAKINQANITTSRRATEKRQARQDLLDYANYAAQAIEVNDQGQIVAPNTSQAVKDARVISAVNAAVLSDNQVDDIAASNEARANQRLILQNRVNQLPVTNAQAAATLTRINQASAYFSANSGLMTPDGKPDKEAIKIRQELAKNTAALQVLRTKNAKLVAQANSEVAGETAKSIKAKAKIQAAIDQNNYDQIKTTISQRNQEVALKQRELNEIKRKYDVLEAKGDARTEAENLTFANTLIALQGKAKELQALQERNFDIETTNLNADTNLKKAQQENKYWSDVATQQSRLENRIESVKLDSIVLKNELLTKGDKLYATTQLQNLENQYKTNVLAAKHLDETIKLKSSETYKKSNFKQKINAIKILNKKQAIELSTLNQQLTQAPDLAVLSDAELKLRIAEVDKKNADLADKALQAKKKLAESISFDYTIKQGEAGITALNAEQQETELLRAAWERVRPNEPYPVARVKNNALFKRALQQFATENTWGDEPFSASENLRAFTGNEFNPMTEQVVKELWNAKAEALAGTNGKVKGNVGLINAQMEIIVNPVSPKYFSTSKKDKDTLTSVPNASLLLSSKRGKDFSELLKAIPKWDDLSIIDKAKGIAEYYRREYKERTGSEITSEKLAQKVAGIFRLAMDVKQKEGNFAMLGIPRIKKLERRHDFTGLAGARRILRFEGRATIDFLSPASMTILINDNQI